MSEGILTETEFDGKLKECEIYQKHPQLLPFIGKNYGNGKFNKLLIIGESHYISNTYLAGENKGNDRKKEELKYIFENWYEISNSDLNNEECNDIGWTTTRKTITGSEARFNKRVRSALNNLSEDLFSCISFMNFFQRPASLKTSINSDEKDIKIANETLQFVCDIIRPDCLLFLSKKSKDNFVGKSENFPDKEKIAVVYHPTAWRWKKNHPVYGKQVFIDFIKNNVIKEAQK